MNILFKITLLILVLISATAKASSTQEQIEIVHPEFSQPLVFNVTLPAGYAKNSDKSYVLMFDFHPYSNTYLSGMHDWMSHNGQWPWLQTIIVTPVVGNRAGMLFDITGKTIPLLDFFDKQLLPTIDQKYRTNGFKIMSGFRDNGTIVLSALINKPDMFNAYIAISPELKDDYAGILSTASTKLAKLDDKPRFLLFSHGTNIKEMHQIPAYKKLNSILQNYSTIQLDWHYKHFENNYFMSLPLLSVITGIEKLFNDIHDGLLPESEVSKKGVNAIIKHYQYLSEHKYGFEISPKNSINSLGFHLLKTSQQAGIQVFKQMIVLYPEDAYSHHNLASAYEKVGDFENAVKHQRDAVKFADNMITWHKKRHQKFLTDYLSKSDNALE
ncbi:esterase [Pseudoalteromonas sp. C2R02]|uniref:esterase n=1 Tax=Pseudoalteromonas sp. C2R02 TaxID=2841565 RepID=UPI001C08B68B|nr:esterase [Pseudoalteromonas sp. C2R02]MBU2972521.1 esterase [Pseudoalteromonas sp. C2R02]